MCTFHMNNIQIYIICITDKDAKNNIACIKLKRKQSNKRSFLLPEKTYKIRTNGFYF